MAADEVDLVSDIQDGSVDAGGGVQQQNGGDGLASTPPGTLRSTDEAPVLEPAKGPSLRDALSAAFKKDGAPVEQDTAQVNEGRPRRPDGTFLSKDEIAAAEAAKVAAPAPSDQVQAPTGMSPAEAAQFAALPPETQQFVARTLATVEAQASRFRNLEEVERVMTPERVNAWAVNGVMPAQALTHLFALSDFAGRDPEQFVLWFAGQHGIDLEMVGMGGDDVDPVLSELRNKIQSLEGTVNGFTQGQQQQAHESIVNDIATFAEEAGTDGQLLRPFFSELGNGILPFIDAVKAQNPNMSHRDVLSEAYDRACWGTPDVRSKMQASVEAKRLAEQRGTAAQARAAGSSVTGAPVSGVTHNNTENRSLRDELRHQFDAARV